ncbi:MAG TPA: hypothetical protein VGW96_01555, partial [Candidatus Eremiobacteraceae bacterium]|nr:hypothetical protein [Candidatus Eremiobacteraceae bacterium]
MAQAFRIETLDRSGRWYLTPGSRSIYDLRIRNDSKNAADCSLVVEDPAIGVSVEPNAFSLRGHEVRTITVTFAPEATSVRSHRVLLSLHSDDDGSLLATFEHPLVATGGTDCSVAMALKGPITEAGELRGFEMTCSVRSQSEARSTFQVSLSPHPAFAIPELPALSLEPGQVGEVVIPIRWNRSVKDTNGWNHPAIFELSVPVSNGKRTSRMRWELIEGKLEPFLKTNGAASINGTVSPQQATVKVEPASQPAAKPEVAKAEIAKPEIAKPTASSNGTQLPILPVVVPAAAAAATAPPVATPTAAPVAATATVAPVAAAPTVSPVAAAAPAATIAAPKPPIAQKSPATETETPAAPILMLNGYVELLMLAAPVDAKPAAAAEKVTTPAAAAVATATQAAPPAPKAAPNEIVELSLFASSIAPSSPAVAPAKNGKVESVTQQPVAAPEKIEAQAPAAPPPAKSAQQSTPPQPAAPQVVAAQAKPAQEAPPKPAPQQELPKPTPQPQEAAPKSVPQVSMPTVAASAPVATPTVQPAAPQWKIVSAESMNAAPPAPAAVAATPVAAAPPAPATPAAPAQDSAASPQPAPAAATVAAPAPKLTPYAPAKWDAADDIVVSAPASANVVKSAAPAPNPAAATLTQQVAQTPPVRVVRERQTNEPMVPRRPRPGLLIGGLAAVAIIVGIFIFKPSNPTQTTSTTPVTVASPVVAANTLNEVQPVQTHKSAAHVVPKTKVVVKATPVAAATVAPAATTKPATPKPATPAAATPRPAAQRQAVVATRPPPAKHVARYGKLYQPETGSVVALGGIEAYYGPRGRAVRVIWSAAEQASANVQLIDNRGMTVNSTSVRGGRQSVIMYLPRGYRGALTVQVS